MNNPFLSSGSGVSGLDRVAYDVGLRSFMQRIFSYMGGGLALTGALAWVVAHTALAPLLYGTPLRWLVALAPMAFVLVIGIKGRNASLSTLQTMFWAFCATMGLSVGSIFLTYTDASIARAFFITAGTFGAMSLWGYTTKKDLSSMGSFLLMGMLGLFIASLVNIFLMSSMLQWVVSVAGVAIFTGLTAWDTQRLKETYSEGYGVEANGKIAVFGALSLYMNFINAFMFLLQLIGVRRD